MIHVMTQCCFNNNWNDGSIPFTIWPFVIKLKLLAEFTCMHENYNRNIQELRNYNYTKTEDYLFLLITTTKHVSVKVYTFSN